MQSDRLNNRLERHHAGVDPIRQLRDIDLDPLAGIGLLRRFDGYGKAVSYLSVRPSASMLNWLVEEKGIAPHISVFDKSKRDDDTFSRSDFRYGPTCDVYHCREESGSE
jgi:hypothetical protein